jgi:hypothetical protein
MGPPRLATMAVDDVTPGLDGAIQPASFHSAQRLFSFLCPHLFCAAHYCPSGCHSCIQTTSHSFVLCTGCPLLRPTTLCLYQSSHCARPSSPFPVAVSSGAPQWALSALQACPMRPCFAMRAAVNTACLLDNLHAMPAPIPPRNCCFTLLLCCRCHDFQLFSH